MVEQQSLLERYRLDEGLAAGGMGTVYVATDQRLNRKVAVKVLKEELAGDPRFVERFRREARAVASLSHPNIANVYDYGVDGRHHFIVMELVEGTDLARVLRTEAPLSVERAARISAQICAALGHAHAAGVIHRDVKPGNVIVAPGDRVKVTDFGIAHAVGDTTLTATGSMLGTAMYLSPEQAMGESVTAASDIYSTGIVLYEMLTGSLPFAGDSPVAIAMKHVSEQVPAPSAVTKKVPRALDTVVARATDKNPERRYSNGEEMEDALTNALRATDPLAPAPVTELNDRAEPSHPPIPGNRWSPRRLGRAVLLAGIVLLLIVAGALAWRLSTDEPNGAPENRSTRNQGGGGRQEESDTSSPSPTPSASAPAFLVPEDIIGADAKDVESSLEEEGFNVLTEDIDSDEPKDTVLEVDPPPGTPVLPGDTITLGVSTGKSEEGPPHTPPGQDKKDEDDDD